MTMAVNLPIRILVSVSAQRYAVLRGLAVVPGINFADTCLLPKLLLTEDPPLRASPLDMGYKHLLMNSRKNPVFSTSSTASLHSSKDTNGHATPGHGNPPLTPLPPL